MDIAAVPATAALTSRVVNLSSLLPPAVAIVRAVGTATAEATPLEKRLIELGFVSGERVEVLYQTRPGGDPFVVRIGDTTFALRRREVETVWVEVSAPSSP